MSTHSASFQYPLSIHWNQEEGRRQGEEGINLIATEDEELAVVEDFGSLSIGVGVGIGIVDASRCVRILIGKTFSIGVFSTGQRGSVHAGKGQE